MSAPAPVLLIAAASGERDGVKEMLERRGHQVTEVDESAQARTVLDTKPDPSLIIVLDLARPEALKFLRAPAVQRAGIPIVCVADRRKPEASSEALRLGIADLVARPVHDDELGAAIANARRVRPHRRRAEARARAGDRAAGGQRVRCVAGDPRNAGAGAAHCPEPVQRAGARRTRHRPGIGGARGPCPEPASRQAVHEDRMRGPLLVDLAAALGDEIAPGTTIYLEEIGELSADAQLELADIARRRADAGADLRFIASTAPRVDDWVARGELRADLVETMGVVRVQLPPLRQRTEDIPLLATHFLKESCRRNGVPAKMFSRSALTLLAALPWPGNMAELRALTERLAVIITRGLLLLEDVLANVRLEGAEALGGPSGTLREARERFERDYVASVLQHHRGRMGDAASHAGHRAHQPLPQDQAAQHPLDRRVSLR